MKTEKVALNLLLWYEENARDLPWRKDTTPYNIWLSEIILQQTRVVYGIDYYKRFLIKFPNIQVLAKAKLNEVLKLWQGLGYYSRAQSIHESAVTICNVYNGVFPKTYESLLLLKGVGPYTAAAIASICFNENMAVVDGNVFRVLARHEGINTAIDTPTGKKIFKQVAQKYIEQTVHSGKYNQAIMELGALVCTKSKPLCRRCPIQKTCVAERTKSFDVLPVKSKKTQIRTRYFNYLVLIKKERLLLKKRIEKDIWKNLYDFPLIESKNGLLTSINVIKHPELFKYTPVEKVICKKVTNSTLHKLTHQHIYVRFFELDFEHAKNNKFIKAKKSQIHKYPMPRLIEKFVDNLDF